MLISANGGTPPDTLHQRFFNSSAIASSGSREEHVVECVGFLRKRLLSLARDAREYFRFSAAEAAFFKREFYKYSLVMSPNDDACEAEEKEASRCVCLPGNGIAAKQI